MDNHVKFLGEEILKRKYEIAKSVHESRIAGISSEEKSQLDAIEVDIIEVRANFIGLFGETLKHLLDQETAFENLLNWGKETAEMTYNLGIPLDEALKDTRFYRSFIWKAIQEEVIEHNMTVDTVFEAGAMIDPLLDHAAYSFSLTYVQFHHQALERAHNAFLELSVPVVPLTEGVAILPLIGDIDTERANLIMEETLKSANKLKLTQLILDLSGVIIVDTMVANQLFKVVNSLKLLGVETILTGIRPEVAQTVVSLGVDFSDLIMKANLQQAFNDIKPTKDLPNSYVNLKEFLTPGHTSN